MPNPNMDGEDERRTTMPKRPPPDIKRNPIPRLKNLQFQQLDVESEKITGAEISDYVNVNFTGDVSVALIKEERNFYDRRHTALATLYERTLPELNRKGANIAWVQHAKTGELVPVVIRGGDASDETEQEETDKNNNNDQQRQPLLLPTPLIASGADVEGGQAYANKAMELSQFDEATHSFDDTVVLIRSAFLFAQGLLAGFCFTTITSESSAAAGGDAAFVVSYQANAMEYRRLFYLLSTLSIVGSIDTFMSITSKVSRDVMKRKKNAPPATTMVGGKETELPVSSGGLMIAFCRALGSAQEGTNVGVAFILMVLHAIAFLCTIIMSQVDVLIAVRGGAGNSVSEDIWTAQLLNSPGFTSLLQNWKGCDQVRLVSSVLAWLLCCFLSWRNLSAVEAKNNEIKRLNDALSEWQIRVDLMEGNEGLEDLSTTAIKRLVSIQQMGLERQQTVLKSLTEASRV